MPRITEYRDLFFPVETRPIFTKIHDDWTKKELEIPNRKAVLNCRTNAVLGVVSKGYRLVTNQEACDYARLCARAVFEDTTEDEWDVSAVDAPESAIYCHMDLTHKTGKLDFDYVMVGTRKDVPDAYGPYIRVTNSYNGKRALVFTIGYYRKVCANGMTAPGKIISFSFPHTYSEIQSTIKFVVNHDRVRRMKRDFSEAFDGLRRYSLDEDYGKELVQSILAIRIPKNAREEKESEQKEPEEKEPKESSERHDLSMNAFQSDWQRLESHIECLYRKYATELGNNAYSALQAATDLASHPIENLCLRKDKNTLQRLAGEWMVDFRRECGDPSFDLSRYLARPTHSHERRVTSRRFGA